MDFKQLLNSTGLSREEAATTLGVSKPTIDSFCTNRRVPGDDLVQKLQNLVQGDTAQGAPIVQTPVSVKELAPGMTTLGGTPLTCIRLTDDSGHPEFDIMSDGFARGFPGDTNYMRGYFRTSHALRRIVEKKYGVSSRIPGMQTLPNLYKITPEGKLTTTDDIPIKWDDKPENCHALVKPGKK